MTDNEQKKMASTGKQPAPLKEVLPRVKRMRQIPGSLAAPANMRKNYVDDPNRVPRIYVLVVAGEVDPIMSQWLRFEFDAPLYAEVITYEWPGHGSREEEQLPLTVSNLGADAFEAFRIPMQTGRFIICGDSVGALVMTYICERAQRELQVQPKAAFALKRGPPHMPVFSKYGYDMLLNDPEDWLRLWRPTIHRLHTKNRISQTAFLKWVNDLRLHNDTLPLGWYQFPCPVIVVFGLDTITEFPPASALTEGVDESWIDERCSITKSGKGVCFTADDFDLWNEWASDVTIYEVECNDDDLVRDDAFHVLLWREVARLCQDTAQVEV